MLEWFVNYFPESNLSYLGKEIQKLVAIKLPVDVSGTMGKFWTDQQLGEPSDVEKGKT